MGIIHINIDISWFREWLSEFDKTKGRLIVHLPAAGGRLHILKPLILEMINICEDSRIAIEFHVTSGDGRRITEDQSSSVSNISFYSIESFFDTPPHPPQSANLHLGMLQRQIYKYAHRVIIRRIDVLSIDDIEELSKVDIIIMGYPPERCGLYDGARWDQEAYDAVKTELDERGLLVRTRYYQRPPSRFFELISPLEIPVGEPPNWYDVWQKRKGL